VPAFVSLCRGPLAASLALSCRSDLSRGPSSIWLHVRDFIGIATSRWPFSPTYPFTLARVRVQHTYGRFHDHIKLNLPLAKTFCLIIWLLRVVLVIISLKMKNATPGMIAPLGQPTLISLYATGYDLSNETQAMIFLSMVLDDSILQVWGNDHARYFLFVISYFTSICKP
jgi:hypothetical protein